MDSSSVGSTGSSYSVKKACPYCSDEMKTEVLFNHMYSKHAPDFLESVKSWMREENDATKPVRIEWRQGGEEEAATISIIYGCLATHKTFTTEERAYRHFKKNPEVHKAHQEELKAMRVRFNKKVNLDSKRVSDERWYSMKKNNDPHAVRAILRFILHQERMIETELLSLIEARPPDFYHSAICFPNDYQHLSCQELIALYHKTKAELRDMEKKKSMNWKKAQHLCIMFWRILSAGDMFSKPHLAHMPDEQFQPDDEFPAASY
jgi:hypothetical protein